MPEILFDTSTYIRSFRDGDPSIFLQRAIKLGEDKYYSRLWLSVVVLEELYVGARSPAAIKLLGKLERDFDKAGRMLIPGQSDWVITGHVLRKIGEKYGFEQVGRARMTNDVLIAMAAARNGITVLTANAKDFGRIAEFRPFDWDLI